MRKRVIELIKKLDKRGYEYIGHDHCNYCELFIKEEENGEFIKRVEINPSYISFEGLRFDINKLEQISYPITLTKDEMKMFNELFEIIQETMQSFPSELAKDQESLDIEYKFETGQTLCEFK